MLIMFDTGNIRGYFCSSQNWAELGGFTILVSISVHFSPLCLKKGMSKKLFLNTTPSAWLHVENTHWFPQVVLVFEKTGFPCSPLTEKTIKLLQPLFHSPSVLLVHLFSFPDFHQVLFTPTSHAPTYPTYQSNTSISAVTNSPLKTNENTCLLLGNRVLL